MSNLETSGSALATGSIASRFITQNDVDEANERREQEWKDAYARIGQEPPPEMMVQEVHDGRTLYERLEISRNAKQEEWDEKMKLSNQYRGLDAEERNFLQSKLDEKRQTEKKVEEEDNVELSAYREALAKKQALELAAAEPQLAVAKPAASTTAPTGARRVPVKQPKKDVKSLMKGVVIKKKKPAASSSTSSSSKGLKRAAEESEQGDKKRKT